MSNMKSNANRVISEKEFIPLMASLMSLVALSIDAILPALDEIGQELLHTEGNEVQLVVSMLFLGLAIGQLFFGTLSDYIGRKPAVSIGIGIFIMGCILSFYATNLPLLLMGRILQGIGLSGPRIISIALVRDQYGGIAMARIMSFIMSIFIIVPAIAPMLGQAVLYWTQWRYIFLLLLTVGVVVGMWFLIRQPETLNTKNRKPFSFPQLFQVIVLILRNPQSFGYTLMSGLIAGMFLSFLSTVQPVFKVYGYDSIFVYGFAVLALFIGLASVVNARIVSRFGVVPIVERALQVLIILSLLCLVVSFMAPLTFWMVVLYFIFAVFCIGLLFGNLNALAMAPLGSVAGIGSSLVGSLSTFISVPIGISIGAYFNGTIQPLLIGFLALGLLSLGIVYVVKNKKQQNVAV